MAPMAPFGRDRLLALLRAPNLDARLPMMFGSPHPCAGIVRVDGKYQLRDLVEDRAASKAFAEERLARNQSFMPEHVTQFMHPTGTVHAEGADAESFCKAIEKLEWPPDW